MTEGREQPATTSAVTAESVQALDGLRLFAPLVLPWACFATFAFIAGSFIERALRAYYQGRFSYAPLPLIVALLLLGVVGIARWCARRRHPLAPAVVVVAAASFVPFFMLDALATLLEPVRFHPLHYLDVFWSERPHPSWVLLALQLFCWAFAPVWMRLWLGRACRRPAVPPANRRWQRVAQIHSVAALILLAWSVFLGFQRSPSEDVWSGIAQLRPVLSQPPGDAAALTAPEEGLRLTTSCEGWCFGLERAGQTAGQTVPQTEDLDEETRYRGTRELRRTPDGHVWLLTERDGSRTVIAAAWRADDLSPITVRLYHVTSAIGPSRFATFTLMLGLVLATAAQALRRRVARRLAHPEAGTTEQARIDVALCDATTIAVLLLPLASAGAMALGWLH